MASSRTARRPSVSFGRRAASACATSSTPDEAAIVLDRHQSGALSLVAPEVVLAEFGHGLRKDVVSGGLSREKATEALDDFLSIGVPTAPTRELANRALVLALDHMATFYDALYVALAEREDCVVLTADERMVNAFTGLHRTASLATVE